MDCGWESFGEQGQHHLYLSHAQSWVLHSPAAQMTEGALYPGVSVQEAGAEGWPPLPQCHLMQQTC